MESVKEKIAGVQVAIRNTIEEKRKINVAIREMRSFNQYWRKGTKSSSGYCESEINSLIKSRDAVDRTLHELRAELLMLRISNRK